jgi:hypothetical protein
MGDDFRVDPIAFAALIRVRESEYEVMMVDGAWSRLQDVTALGRILDRDEAVRHPLSNEVFRLIDHIVHEDPEIYGYLRLPR